MPEAYRITDQSQAHFLTCTITHWIDLFTRPAFADVVVRSLRHCQDQKGLNLHAWCLMPNHLHLIGSSKNGFLLSDIVRDFKKYTANAIMQMLRNTDITESRRDWMMRAFYRAGADNPDNIYFQLWQPGYHPIQLSDRGRAEQRLHYLHDNPVRAGYVREPWDWRYSSARDYCLQESGLLPVRLL